MADKLKPLTVLSLFDGISCGRVALQRANIPVAKYYASEIDKYAIEIAQKNFPNTIQLGNVKEIDFTKFVGKIDLLIGGSPCQDLSIAGKHKGLKGERSGLLFNYIQALNIIKPKYFLLENNASMSKENKDKITELMGVEPMLINSALFSAQNRKRLYWTNIQIQEIIDKKIILQDILEFGTTPRKKSKTVRCGGSGSSWGNKHEWDMPNPERRYTTIELERLQTLPDNYTNCGVSETQRRKTIGNGWTVDVISHIFSFIPKED